MDKVLEFVKQNVKVAVTVVLFGVAVTVGWAKGCTVDVGTDPVPAVVVEAPVDAGQ